MKLIKGLLKIVVLLVVLVIIAVAVVLFYIDSIAKTAVEKGGTLALGVPTRVDSIDVSIFSGECDMSNLRVTNPSGFEAAHFMRLAHGEVQVEPKSLRSEEVVVPKILLDGVQVAIEKNKSGANYEVILNNLKNLSRKPAEDEPAEPAPAPEEDAKKGYVIRNLTIKNVTVDVSVSGLLNPIKTQVKLPKDIVLENVGSGQDNGAQMKEVVAVIVEAVLTAVVEQGGGLIPDSIAGELKDGLKGVEAIGQLGVDIIGGMGQSVPEKLGETVGDAVKTSAEAVGGAGEAVKDAGEKAVEKTGELLEGIGNVLQGKKKEEETSE